MFSKYKYSFILELEKKYASSFKMCTTNKIEVLPPILKKIGLVYYLLFLVVEEPLLTQSYRPIKRPIGVIMLNKNGTEAEKMYDMQNYEFYPAKVDFEMEYFDINAYPTYWPNRTKENEERFKICLENLLVVAKNTNIFNFVLNYSRMW